MLIRGFTVAIVWHGVGALGVWRSRPAVALRVRLRASPSAQDDTRAEMECRGSVRSTIGDPDLRSPSGFDFGLRPPLRMTRRGGVMLFQCGGTIMQWSPPHCLLML